MACLNRSHILTISFSVLSDPESVDRAIQDNLLSPIPTENRKKAVRGDCKRRNRIIHLVPDRFLQLLAMPFCPTYLLSQSVHAERKGGKRGEREEDKR